MRGDLVKSFLKLNRVNIETIDEATSKSDELISREAEGDVALIEIYWDFRSNNGYQSLK